MHGISLSYIAKEDGFEIHREFTQEHHLALASIGTQRLAGACSVGGDVCAALRCVMERKHVRETDETW